MRFSEARKSYLAHLIVSTLRNEGLAAVENERLALAEIKRVLEQDHETEARIDALVRKENRVAVAPRAPGSREWDVLYRQYYEAEARKHKAG